MKGSFPKNSIKKAFRIVSSFSLVLLYICTLTGSFLLSYLLGIDDWKEFDPRAVSEMDLSTVLLDESGSEFARLYNTEDRIYCKIETLPEYTKNAFIAIEDARFYTHPGIDVIRIFGALIEDIKSASLSQGASTISQQLAKLSALNSSKTISRKLTEIMMAFKIEKYYEKDEILELYLNTVYFGNGAYGIGTAAIKYFGKNAGELSISESACLAAILKAPGNYAPHIAPENSIKRRNLVLLQMYNYGFITEAEYSSAKSEKLVLAKKAEDDYPFGYYTDYTLSEAKKLLCINYKELYSGGYTIETALDRSIQNEFERVSKDNSSFPKNAADGTAVETAAVAIDSKTGAVKALIGGRKHEARLAFSRAYQMKRQPGSAIKPVLVFAPAIEYLGLNPTSLLLDAQMDFDGWTPREKSYRGWMTLREVCSESRNIPTVSLLYDVGIDKAIEYAKKVGISFGKEDDSLRLALGGFSEGLSPLELASAYTSFANNGKYSKGFSILRITDKNGNIIYEKKPVFSSVLSKKSAFLINSMLKSTVKNGTADALYIESIPLSAKTGTSSFGDTENNKDAWVVAYNPENIICCWMGFDRTDSEHCLKKGETGGSYPALFVKKVFEKIYAGKAAPDFSIPYGVYPVEIDLDFLYGQKRVVLADAESQNKTTEYFTADKLPSESAVYYKNEYPSDFSVNRSYWMQPLVSFTGQKGLVYSLYREDSLGSKRLLTKLTGNGNKSDYMDFSASNRENYTYSLEYSLPPGAMFIKGSERKGAASVYLPGSEAQNTYGNPEY